MRFVESRQPLTPEGEQQVRDFFPSTAARVAALFDDARRARHSADYPPKQDVIDLGIAGDFTGMI